MPGRLLLVQDGHLRPPEAHAASIPVGSPAWFGWLDAPDTRSFAFQGARGRMTVRKDARPRGGAYWVGYRKVGGKLRNVYLGKSTDLTLARLEDAAASLAGTPGPAEERTETAAAASATPLPARRRGIADARATRPVPEARLADPLDTLLRTKLRMPAPPPARVPRPRLLERLQLLTERPLGVIIAPAGFGKTTLVQSWLDRAAGGGMGVAWLALDAQDNDPARFWLYVIAALRTRYPTIGADALYLLRGGAPSLGEVSTILANDLAASTPPSAPAAAAQTILVLDDYHLITAPAIHESLAALLAALPASIHLLLTSRHDPPLPLARLRARGQLLELRAADLRFTTAEAAQFLNECMGLRLSGADITALERRTEGWIAGLQMAALSMQDRVDRSGFIRSLSGSHRYVLDYLVEEVLQDQPEEVQGFLLSTAILDRLCAGLCAAVQAGIPGATPAGHGVAGGDENQAAAQAMLEDLEKRNLFLTPLDDERHWYRYHQLFAEVLRVRGRETWPGTLPQLHRNAAAWYEAQSGDEGDSATLEAALDHWLAAGSADDLVQAARIVERTGEMLWSRGEGGTLLRWLDRLPESLVRRRPWLAVLDALMLQSESRLDRVPGLLAAAERALEAEPAADTQTHPADSRVEQRQIRGWIAAVRSQLARNREDFPGAIALATEALGLLPETDRRGRVGAYWGLALAQHMEGELAPALQSYRATAALANPTEDPYLEDICRCLQAHVLYEQGQLRAMDAPVRSLAARAMQDLQRPIPGLDPDRPAAVPPIAGWALVELGRAALARNEGPRAAELLAGGLALAQRGAIRDAICMGYSTLVPLYLAQGDAERAGGVAAEFTRLAQATAYPLYLDWAAAVATRVALAQGDLTAAATWARAYTPRPAALFYAHKLAYATFVRVLLAEGRRDEALDWIAQQLPLAEAGGHTMTVIELRVLQAVAHDGSGRSADAQAALDPALALAAPETVLRPFLDAGRALALLLAERAGRRDQTDRLAPFIGHLLRAFPQEERFGLSVPPVPGPASPPTPGLFEPLTPREAEILRLLSQGYATPEIAARLVVSPGTVKTHLHHLYGKLDARDRAHALVRARALGLLV